MSQLRCWIRMDERKYFEVVSGAETKENAVTVILITHYMEEVVDADHVYRNGSTDKW